MDHAWTVSPYWFIFIKKNASSLLFISFNTSSFPILSYFQPVLIKPPPLRIPSYIRTSDTNIRIPVRKMKPKNRKMEKKKQKDYITPATINR